VLVLDEPFSGLDPVVRDDLVHGVLELAGEEQWTVLISSHDLDEVERLVDVVAFMDGGGLLQSEPLTDLQRRFRAIEVTVDDGLVKPAAEDRLSRMWIGRTSAGRVVRFVDTRYLPRETEREIEAAFPGSRVETRPMTLREILIALVRHERSRTGWPWHSSGSMASCRTPPASARRRLAFGWRSERSAPTSCGSSSDRV
jgi:ABC-2 type transport system ATP-binding protein